MQYLISSLWKLPKATRDELNLDKESQDKPDPKSSSLMAAACKDCGQYNFPPKFNCRYCGSPRVEMVSVSHDYDPHPGVFVFGAKSDSAKPN